jgi:hypothetical protein
MNSRTLHDENVDMEGIEARDEDGDDENDLVESTEDEFSDVLHEALDLYAEENGFRARGSAPLRTPATSP